jgi:hypothetical protein
MSDPTPTKAIFRHTIRFYDALADRATVEEGLTVYRGHPTAVATKELDLPLPYYSKMREILITVGSVKQIKRGSGKTESVWVLVKPPTDADFAGVDPTTNKLSPEFRLYQLANDAAVARIQDQLGGLNVAYALKELSDKIDEQQVQLNLLKLHIKAILKEKQ